MILQLRIKISTVLSEQPPASANQPSLKDFGQEWPYSCVQVYLVSFYHLVPVFLLMSTTHHAFTSEYELPFTPPFSLIYRESPPPSVYQVLSVFFMLLEMITP